VCSVFGLLTLLGIACPVARADDGRPAPIRGSVWDVGVRAQLQAMVNAYGFHSVNHFCIVWYPGPGEHNFSGPFVYWPTQDKFIVWGPGSDLILGSSYYFDIRRDVVPDDEDPTTMYPHFSEVQSIIDDCRRYGNAYTIKKTVGGWVPIRKFSQFATVRAQFQFLVDNVATAKENDFCIVGQSDGPFLGAYVVWRTEDKLILWLPSPHDVYEPISIAYASVQIDLKNGLRDSEDANDHRNEMQRSYAMSIVQACQKVGEDFVVGKSN